MPLGIVFRRGPSKQVCAIGWNRADDTFIVGQWFKGRIYERRSDLSPDGRHLIYFALKGHPGSNKSISVTAISRAPYLKAIGTWEKADSRYGGGLFIDQHTYWINDDRGHRPVTVPRELKKVAHYRGENTFGSDCPGVYFLRLQRDGWTLKGCQDVAEGRRVGVFEKPAGPGWVLRKTAYMTPSNLPDANELISSTSGTQLPIAEWEWVDVDRTRLVWGVGGKLFAGRLADDGLHDERQLFDFNPLAFVQRPAPY